MPDETASTRAAPGWYFDGYAQRWWDGSRWGQYAPVPIDPSSDAAGKTMAIISHCGAFAGGFVLPLILYLIEKDKNSFARDHAREALNYQLTVMTVFLLGFAIAVPSLFLSVDTSEADSIPWGVGVFIVVWGGLMLINIASWIFAIIGIVKANRLERWTYPVRIPFVRN